MSDNGMLLGATCCCGLNILIPIVVTLAFVYMYRGRGMSRLKFVGATAILSAILAFLATGLVIALSMTSAAEQSAQESGYGSSGAFVLGYVGASGLMAGVASALITFVIAVILAVIARYLTEDRTPRTAANETVNIKPGY